MKKEKKWLKILIFCLILIGSYLVYFYLNEIKNFILENKKISWLIYILAWIILPIFFFPAAILAVFGGILFGFVYGSFLTIVAAMINLSLMYFIGKFLSFKSLDINLENKEFSVILIMRFLPFIPYNLLNYTCGFLRVNFLKYFLASFFGIIPATIILINLGKNVLYYKSNEFLWAIFYFILLIIFSFWINYVYKRHYNYKK